MSLEKILKEVSLGSTNKTHRFYPEKSNWRFLIQKNKLKTENKIIFYYLVVAFNLRIKKAKESNCKSIKELRTFIKETIRKEGWLSCRLI